jgi:hypothetical protein
MEKQSKSMSDRLVAWGIASSPEQASQMLLWFAIGVIILAVGISWFALSPGSQIPPPPPTVN